MKRFVLACLTLLLLLFLAACGSVEPEVPATDSAADTLSFSIDPTTQEAQLLEATDADLSTQTKSGRRVLTHKDLAVKSIKFTFQQGNVLKIDAAFKNVSACNLSEFTFTQGRYTRNIVSSTEPVVTAKDLGGDGVLSPKEVTKPLTFKVKHKRKPFIYQVKVEALVSCEPQGFDLGITVTSQADTVTVGETINYSVTVTNNGPAVVKDARFSGELGGTGTEWLVSDGLLPEGCGYANSTGTPFNKKLVCELGTLAAGEKKQVNLTARAFTVGVAETLFVVFPEPFKEDSDGTNDSAFFDTTVIAGPPEPVDLQVAVFSRQGQVPVGKPINYQINVDRLSGTATGVKLTADFAVPVVLVSVEPDAPCIIEKMSDNDYSLGCDLDLSISSDTVVKLTGETSETGTFSASATVSSNETDSNPVDNTSTFEVEVFENGNTCTDSFVIPDATLKLSLRKALSKPEGDITCADMAGLTELVVEEYDDDIGDPLIPASLEGLQFATNLTSLRFRSASTNPDDYLEPLSELINLERLTIFVYQEYADDDFPNLDLTPLSGLTNLTYLSLPDSQVGDLTPLSGLTNLTELSAPDSNVTDYSPLSGLTKLVKLNLSNYSYSQNSLERVTDLGFLEKLTALDDLDLSGNLVTDLSPLLANPGIGEGDDRINLTANCLDLTPGSDDSGDAATLEDRNPNIQNVDARFQREGEEAAKCSK